MKHYSAFDIFQPFTNVIAIFSHRVKHTLGLVSFSFIKELLSDFNVQSTLVCAGNPTVNTQENTPCPYRAVGLLLMLIIQKSHDSGVGCKCATLLQNFTFTHIH